MKKIEELTVLRFFGAIIVVIYHFGLDSLKLSYALVNGPVMVTFFFVLSGFVMYLSHHKKSERNYEFYALRLLRIYPMYFISLLVFLMFCYVNKIEQSKFSIAYNLLLIQSIIPPHPLSLNSPGWAASVEIVFYFMFPFILLILKRLEVTTKAMLVYSLLLWFATQACLVFVLNNGYYGGFPSISHDFIYYSPISHLCSFLLGIGGAMLFNDLSNRINASESRRNLILTLSLVLPFFIMYVVVDVDKNANIKLPWGSSLFAPLFLMTILSMSLFHSKFTKVLCFPVFVLLGEASYSIYILQYPMHLFYEKHITPSINIHQGYHFLIYLIALVLISVVTHRLIENKIIIKAKKTLIQRSYPVANK